VITVSSIDYATRSVTYSDGQVLHYGPTSIPPEVGDQLQDYWSERPEPHSTGYPRFALHLEFDDDDFAPAFANPEASDELPTATPGYDLYLANLSVFYRFAVDCSSIPRSVDQSLFWIPFYIFIEFCYFLVRSTFFVMMFVILTTLFSVRILIELIPHPFHYLRLYGPKWVTEWRAYARKVLAKLILPFKFYFESFLGNPILFCIFLAPLIYLKFFFITDSLLIKILIEIATGFVEILPYALHDWDEIEHDDSPFDTSYYLPLPDEEDHPMTIRIE